MFVFHQSSQIMILFLYMDDIVLIGNTPSLLSSFIITLGNEVEIKDLGPLNYFLGLEVHSLRLGIHLSQTKYMLDLLQHSGMTECKPCNMPLSAKSQLYATDGDPLSDAFEYRQLVDSLQYLTLTRLDISYAVHHVAQFMSSPRMTHLVAVKCILRYLKGMPDLGLQYRPSSGPLAIYAFSDAD